MTLADALTLEQLEQVARGAPPPALDDDARRRIAAARAVVERAVDDGEVVYGASVFLLRRPDSL